MRGNAREDIGRAIAGRVPMRQLIQFRNYRPQSVYPDKRMRSSDWDLLLPCMKCGGLGTRTAKQYIIRRPTRRPSQDSLGPESDTRQPSKLFPANHFAARTSKHIAQNTAAMAKLLIQTYSGVPKCWASSVQSQPPFKCPAALIAIVPYKCIFSLGMLVHWRAIKMAALGGQNHRRPSLPFVR